tara:strand:+ start:62 stop:409 length:348 start_codon:yes stop_codon:yes gene_type:complete
METKHTPRTWEMGIDGRVTSTYPSNNGKICDMEDRTHWTTQVVCKIETNLGSNVLNERQRADAKLILAAPDLLETLNSLVNRIEKNWDAIASGGQQGILTALLHESKQTIEKATK